MISGQKKKNLAAARLPQLQKPRPQVSSSEPASAAALFETDTITSRAPSTARTPPATPQVSPQLPKRSPLTAASGSTSLSSTAQASGTATLPPISTALNPAVDAHSAGPRSAAARSSAPTSVMSPLLVTPQGAPGQLQQQHSAFAAPVAPAPQKDLNSFRRTSTNKKARLSFSKSHGQAHRHLPTAADVARISRWWLRCRMAVLLKQKRPSQFAAQYVAEKEQQRRRTVERARFVIERFLLKCAHSMRSYVDDKSFLRMSRVSTAINTFLRCKQSQAIALSRYLKRVQRSYAMMLRCWKKSATYRRRVQQTADNDDFYVILAAESIERRERYRNEKLEWLQHVQQFMRAPCYQKFRSEQATSSVVSAAAATVATLVALAADEGTDEEVNGFSFCFNAEGSVELPLLQSTAKISFAAPGRSPGQNPPASGDAVALSPGRKKSLSVTMQSSPLRAVHHKSFRRSSLSLHEMNRSGSISLDVMLGASPVNRTTTASSGKALLAGSRVRLPEGDAERRDQDPGFSPELVCTAGLSFFGDDATYLEQVAGSPLLLAYSKRAGAAAGDVALSDARMQMLNQQLLYPLRAGVSPTHVTLKVAVSETFLSDWCSWYATTDFQHPDTTNSGGGGGAQRELGRRRSAVIRKQVGGEYANAQRRLSVAASKARKLSGVSEADSYKTQIRFSARRNSEVVSRSCAAVAKVNNAAHPSPLRNRNGAGPVKVLSLPVGSPVFSVDLETERMLIQERTRRSRLVVQAARILADIGERMEEERVRDLADLLPVAQRASVTAERETMFRYGSK